MAHFLAHITHPVWWLTIHTSRVAVVVAVLVGIMKAATWLDGRNEEEN